MKKKVFIVISFLGLFSILLFAKPRFTNLGNGTIKDNKTNLIWQQCSAGQSGPQCELGSATKYELKSIYDGEEWLGYNTEVIYTEAKNYCNGLKLGGLKWRLPERNELITIVNYTRAKPAINTDFFPNTPYDENDWTDIHYWTNTKYHMGEGYYLITFQFGKIEGWGSDIYVRCVAK